MLDYGMPDCWLFKQRHPVEWATFGCGPGGVGDYLVPDTMWGLDISEACRIHDWFYRFCPDRSAEAKAFADNLMLQNCLAIVNAKSKSWTLKHLRTVRCHTYHFMVTHFGQSSWDECKSVRDKS